MNIDIKFICSQRVVNENYMSSLSDMDIKYHNVEINNESVISQLLESVDYNFYDTFIAEEFYSQYSKGGRNILDTQDLHFLREVRRSLFNFDTDAIKYDIDYCIDDNTFLNNPHFQREMAAVLRSDLIIVSSDFEYHILTGLLKISKDRVVYLPFFYDKINSDVNEIFDKRKNFVFIGNYLHKPNKDSIIVGAKYIYPLIIEEFRKRDLKPPNLDIYGINIDKDIKDLEGEFIKVKGEMKSLSQMSKYRALIAPIAYGAGIKGKILDSWNNLLPVITTYYGSESLFLNRYDTKNKSTYSTLMEDYYQFIKANEDNFGGFISKDYNDFAMKSYNLYTDKDTWTEKVMKGINIFNKNMTFDANFSDFEISLKLCYDSLQDYTKYVLKSEFLSATKFKSKYIELKNKH
jgi:hypothetical protein